MSHFRSHKRQYGILLVVTAIIGLTIFAINRSEHWSFNGTSQVTVFAPHDNTTIFVDGKAQAVLARGESIDLTVRAGNRSVLAAATGFWPWSKTISADQDGQLTLAPFLLPIDPSIREIESGDSQYPSLVLKIQQTTLPKPGGKSLAVGDVELVVDEDVIIASWLGEPTRIPWDFCFNTQEPVVCNLNIDVVRSLTEVRSVDFYPKRNDVIIFAADNGVFAIELNQDEIQNFQTIYEGVKPRFALIEDKIYILDGIKLLEVTI